MKGGFGHAHDRKERVLVASGGPSQGAALRVRVDEKEAVFGDREGGGKIDGDGGLSHPAFLAQNANDHCIAFL